MLNIATTQRSSSSSGNGYTGEGRLSGEERQLKPCRGAPSVALGRGLLLLPSLLLLLLLSPLMIGRHQTDTAKAVSPAFAAAVAAAAGSAEPHYLMR